jgi:hypothetical protein
MFNPQANYVNFFLIGVGGCLAVYTLRQALIRRHEFGTLLRNASTARWLTTALVCLSLMSISFGFSGVFVPSSASRYLDYLGVVAGIGFLIALFRFELIATPSRKKSPTSHQRPNGAD